MNRIFKRRKPVKHYPEELTPEKLKLLNDASLQTLNRLYERCYEEGIARGPLIDAIEKEIFLKTIKEERWHIDRIYWLKKFIRKKKEDQHEQQLRT